MNKIRIKLVLSVLVLMLMPINVFSIKAQGQDSTNRGVLAMCESVESKVKESVNKHEQSRERLRLLYQKRKENIEEMLIRLEGKGYNVAKIEADLQQMVSLMSRFSEQYNAYIGLLKETRDYACGQSEGQFKDKLVQSRNQLKNVHMVSAEMRTFFSGTLKLHLLELKEEIQTNTASK